MSEVSGRALEAVGGAYVIVRSPVNKGTHAVVPGRDRALCGREVEGWSPDPAATSFDCKACLHKQAKRESARAARKCRCGHSRGSHQGRVHVHGAASTLCCDEPGCGCHFFAEPTRGPSVEVSFSAGAVRIQGTPDQREALNACRECGVPIALDSCHWKHRKLCCACGNKRGDQP